MSQKRRIGRATNPYQRLGEIQVGNPDVLVVRQLLLGWAEGERFRQNDSLPSVVYEEAREAA